jgi:hypothetical protein
VALVDQLRQLAHDGGAALDLLGLAVKRHHVAAQVDVAAEMLLERPEDLVVGARECRGDLVGQLDLAPQESASLTLALTRAPSARPPTFAIAAFMAVPICFISTAPVSAIAPATIESSSSSLSSAGR